MDEPSVQKRRLEPGTSSASSSGISSVSSSLPIDQQQQQQQLPAPELAQQQQPQGQMWPPPQTSAPVVPKKKRFCQFCRNHQISKPTKGHKKVCLYRFCVCTKCKNTRERHIVMAKQVAIKREKESAAHRQKDDTDVFPENIPNLVPPDTTQVNSGAAHPGSPQRILWERILTVLMEKGYRIDTYPLLHIIFKEVTSDLPVLYQKIAESLLELQNIKPLIVAEMTQLEPVAAAQSAGVPVLDYQYWLDGFDLKALRVHHYELYTKSYHEQLRHGGSPLWKHNPFPATAEIPFDFMSQGGNGPTVSRWKCTMCVVGESCDGAGREVHGAMCMAKYDTTAKYRRMVDAGLELEERPEWGVQFLERRRIILTKKCWQTLVTINATRLQKQVGWESNRYRRRQIRVRPSKMSIFDDCKLRLAETSRLEDVRSN